MNTQSVELPGCLTNKSEVFGFYSTKDYSEFVAYLMLKRGPHCFYSLNGTRIARHGGGTYKNHTLDSGTEGDKYHL